MKKQIYDIALELRTTESNRSFFDIIFEDGDIKTVNSYATTLFLTVGVDDRAHVGMVKTQINRGGWWGNSLKRTRRTNIGSCLWVIEHETFSDAKRIRGEALLKTAFDFMVTDGLAKSVIVNSVNIDKDGKNGYQYTIKIVTLQDVTLDRTYKLWLNT